MQPFPSSRKWSLSSIGPVTLDSGEVRFLRHPRRRAVHLLISLFLKIRRWISLLLRLLHRPRFLLRRSPLRLPWLSHRRKSSLRRRTSFSRSLRAWLSISLGRIFWTQILREPIWNFLRRPSASRPAPRLCPQPSPETEAYPTES